MTVVADFNVVIGDVPQSVPISAADPTPNVGRPFNTSEPVSVGGELGPSAAFLICSVANIDNTLEVFVNSQGPVGMLLVTTSPGFSTQMVTMAGNRLKNGNNIISVGLVGGWKGVSHSFQIKNLICFYHQDSD